MSVSVGPRHSVVEAEAPPTAGPSEPAAAGPIDRERVAPPPAATGVDSSAGAATRVLTAVLLPFVSVWEIGKAVVRRLVGGAFRAVQGSARGLSGVAGHLGRFLGRLLTPIVRSVRRVTRSTARVLGTAFFVTARVLRPLWAAVVVVTRPVACGMRAVAWLIVRTLRLVAQGLTVVIDVLYRAVALVAVLIWRACTPIGRLIALLAKAVAWLIVGTLRLVARGLTVVIDVLYRAVALVAGLIWRACTPIGRLIALFAKAVAWLIVGMLRLVAQGLTVVIDVLYGAVALVARAIGRTVAFLLRPPLSGATAIMKCLVRTVGTAARSTIWPVARVFSWIARSLSSSSGRVMQGSLVAFGTARHHARVAPRAGAITALEVSSAVGPMPYLDERPLESVFAMTSHQNPYLRPGESRVEAVVSVTADMRTLERGPREAVEIFLLDCSASMGHPWDKVRALRKATRAALEILPDGVWFAVVRGAESAEVIFPLTGGLVQASPTTRKEAATAVAALQPVGGTAIGRWLELAARLSMLRPAAIHHTLLLTDGKDEDEAERELDLAVAGCVGRLQCDCRGIGSDWAVSELRKISSALLGTVDIIRQPVDMEDDFRNVIGAALSRHLEASLRIWVPEHAKVRFVRQVAPTIEDLTDRAKAIDAHTFEIPTGAWMTERREYHVSVDVPPGPIGAEMLGCRVSIVVGDRKLADSPVTAHWTGEELLYAPMSAEVAHYTDQAELARSIQMGLEARRAGHEQRATDMLGRAVKLAAQSGQHATSQLLADVVDVDDAMTGKIRLKAHVEDADEMALDARSTRTNRARDE